MTVLTGRADADDALRVLVLDDSAADAELVLEMLEDELPAARITLAVTLQEALALLDVGLDVVLTDLSLPDADGLQALAALRAALPDVPIVVMTGYGDRATAMGAMAAGADDYLVKGSHDARAVATAVLYAVQRRRAHADARRFEKFALSLLDAMEEVTCAVDATGRVVAVNEAWRRFASANGGDADVTGVGADYLAVCESASDDTADAVARGLRHVLAGVVERAEVEYPCHSSDQQRWYSLRINPLPEGGAVLIHVDITAVKRAEQAAAYRTMHDPLTNLPNRNLLHDRLSQALAWAGQRDVQVGVALLDIDHFKRVNDSLGHEAGDAVLVAVAERLRAQLRATQTLARLAGDEFVVVWPEVASADDAEGRAEELRTAFDEPFDIDGELVDVSVSVGVAVGAPPELPDDLLLAADAAMNDAKARGKGRARLYSPELRDEAAALIRTERELREALREGQFVLHYQPVVDLQSGVVRGLEALVRWQHADGLRMPDTFIPVAEASGLIVPLGKWVLEEACRQASEWATGGLQLDVAVNLSVRQVSHPDVLETLRGAIRRHRLDPRRLILEVTESAVMEDAEAAQEALTAIAALGVSIAIDDFGTGYSSLLYLKRYPIQVLKIDRSFVAGMGTNGDDDAIVASIISLSRAVGSICIAEGVETAAQHTALRALGCELAQGYLFAPPVPAEEVPAVLTACNARFSSSRQHQTRSEDAVLDPAVRRRIDVLHGQGASLHTIAAALNHDNVATPQGTRWHSTAVGRVLSGTYRAGSRGRARPLGRGVVASGPQPAHTVDVYADSAGLAQRLAAQLSSELRTGGAVLIVATPPHRDLIHRELAENGLDVAALEQAGRLAALDAATTLSRLMIDGHLSARLFRDVIGSTVETALGIHGTLSIYGEMVSLLWSEGDHRTALALEDMWNDLRTRLPFSLHCGYPQSALAAHGTAVDVARMHAQHAQQVVSV